MQSASEDVSGAFLLLPEETAGNDAMFQQLPNASGNKRHNRKRFGKFTKNLRLFLVKIPLEIHMGGGIRIENGAEFSSKQPLSNKKNKEREGKS